MTSIEESPLQLSLLIEESLLQFFLLSLILQVLISTGKGALFSLDLLTSSTTSTPLTTFTSAMEIASPMKEKILARYSPSSSLSTFFSVRVDRYGSDSIFTCSSGVLLITRPLWYQTRLGRGTPMNSTS
ncbi:hypothetical protein TYRP_007697 [Tyrophagus putrescentiae]|nr:hypothetical protein TYRP_007697 [Tyrophagus putrescentiae]